MFRKPGGLDTYNLNKKTSQVIVCISSLQGKSWQSSDVIFVPSYSLRVDYVEQKSISITRDYGTKGMISFIIEMFNKFLVYVGQSKNYSLGSAN